MEFSQVELADLDEIAEEILKFVGDYRTLMFFGEMGVGKTTLILKIIRKLGAEEAGSSPTFSIVNEYSAANGDPIYHFDFYRIESEDEIYDIGYEEYFFSGNYCLVEWPEKMGTLYPDDAVEIKIEQQGAKRSIKVNLPS
jgi:tRNA threonylcarbamoyladenosine biosynthesis protein TsaE